MKIFVLIFSIFLSSSFACNHGNCKHDEIVVSSKTLDKPFHELTEQEQNDVIKYLTHSAHEAMELENDYETKNKVYKKFLELKDNMKFDVIRKQAIRWFHGSPYPEMALDLALLFPLSHGLESSVLLVFTPVLTYLGYTEAAWVTGAVGGVIIFPGLDPLCIFLQATYVGSPKFRKGFRKFRVAMFKIPGYLGIYSALRWLYDTKDRYEQLSEVLENGGTTKFISKKLQEGKILYNVSLKKDAPTIVKMNFSHDEGAMLLHDIELDIKQILSMGKKEDDLLRNQLKDFNWNVRDAVFRSIKSYRNNDMKNYKKLFHVEGFHTKENILKIEFNEKAVRMNPIKKLSDKAKRLCNLKFRKKASIF